jgi:hypothetical protein
MQVRIAFSAATRAKADVLLIDEVLAVGDAAFQRKCFEHFRALKKKGTTIVFVSHDVSAVREFCDRAILNEDRSIVAQGSGAIRYSVVDVSALLRDEGSLTLELEAMAEQDVDEIVYGSLIKNSSGAPVLGTNSLLKKQPTGSLRRGERLSDRPAGPRGVRPLGRGGVLHGGQGREDPLHRDARHVAGGHQGARRGGVGALRNEGPSGAATSSPTCAYVTRLRPAS